MDEKENCCICLEEIKDTNFCVLRCKHQFHLGCILTLAEGREDNNKKCPLCRKYYMATRPYNTKIKEDGRINILFFLKKNLDYVDFHFLQIDFKISKYDVSNIICTRSGTISSYEWGRNNKNSNQEYFVTSGENSLIPKVLPLEVNVEFDLEKYFDYDNFDEVDEKTIQFLFKIDVGKNNKCFVEKCTFLGDNEDYDFDDYTSYIPSLDFDELDIYETGKKGKRKRRKGRNQDM